MELDRNIPFWKELSDNKQLVLCDMAFNLGVPKLMQFKKMLLSLHPDNRDDEEAASQLLDSNYARQLPARSQRNAELIREE
jgi:lysozyme